VTAAVGPRSEREDRNRAQLVARGSRLRRFRFSRERAPEHVNVAFVAVADEPRDVEVDTAEIGRRVVRRLTDGRAPHNFARPSFGIRIVLFLGPEATRGVVVQRGGVGGIGVAVRGSIVLLSLLRAAIAGCATAGGLTRGEANAVHLVYDARKRRVRGRPRVRLRERITSQIVGTYNLRPGRHDSSVTGRSCI
jgi:hypothetical protein